MRLRAEEPAPLVAVRGLHKTYTRRRGIFRAAQSISAVQGVSFEIAGGSTVVLCGESGSGKSTVAKCISGIETWDGGEVWLEGRATSQIPARQRMAAFRSVQLVFQDSASSLNPSFTVEEIIAEPLVIVGAGSTADQSREALALMERVGLNRAWAGRRPLEFSGGQRQRIAIARALAAHARLIIFDEAFTGLDLLTREAIVALLKKLQSEHALTYLHITHDAEWAERWADETIVMKMGEIIQRKKLARVPAEIEREDETALVPAGVEA